MLSTTEKIVTLRTVRLFAQTPEPILAEVAALLEEVSFQAEEPVFAQGDYGDAMYIIVEGRVRVHSGGRTLSLMEQNSVFGEMAALDPEPRSPSVTAVEPVRLLRLGREPLFALMTTQPEVATGIIQLLCQHLRARTTSMVEDYHYLQQVARLTAAASAVESGVYTPAALDEVSGRTDALGQLARVFQRMIREVYAREQRLQQEVQQLRIAIDRGKTERQVAEITETDYFRQLQDKAQQLRQRAGSTKGES